MTRLERVLVGLALSLAATAPLTAQQPVPAPAEHGPVWVRLGGQERARVESWRNFGFAATPNHDDDFVLQRALLSADVHLGARLRVFVEGRSAVLTDRDLPGGRRAIDADDIDLQNAYVELSLAPNTRVGVAARVGRQDLLFGRQRLISPLDWVNSRRAFDAIRATANGGSWTFDALFGNPVQVLKTGFNRRDGTVDFGGVYAQRKATHPLALDLYWLVLQRDAATFNGTTGREMRHTVGTRVSRAPGQLVGLDAEAAYQFGSVGEGTISAGMVSVDLVVAPPRIRAAPRVHAGFDFASGDRVAGGDVQTFNQLFPLGHAFFGFIDVVGRQNVLAANAGVGVKAFAGVHVDMTVHRFRRASAADGLYNAAGSVERPAGVAASKDVGTEVDFTATGRFGRRVSALLGYSVLFAGSFLEQTGAARDIRFAYGSLQLTY